LTLDLASPHVQQLVADGESERPTQRNVHARMRHNAFGSNIGMRAAIVDKAASGGQPIRATSSTDGAEKPARPTAP